MTHVYIYFLGNCTLVGLGLSLLKWYIFVAQLRLKIPSPDIINGKWLKRFLELPSHAEESIILIDSPPSN